MRDYRKLHNDLNRNGFGGTPDYDFLKKGFKWGLLLSLFAFIGILLAL